jgi:hypothetical protein
VRYAIVDDHKVNFLIDWRIEIHSKSGIDGVRQDDGFRRRPVRAEILSNYHGLIAIYLLTNHSFQFLFPFSVLSLFLDGGDQRSTSPSPITFHPLFSA